MTDHSRGEPAAPGSEAASRRSVLGALGAAVGGVAGIGTLAASSRPAAAVDGDPAAFEAGNAPTVTSNEGRVEAVYLSPTVNASWTDFSDGVDTVTITVAVGSDEGVDEVYRETLTADEPEATPGDVTTVEAFDHGTVDGELTVAFDRVDATARGDAVTSETLSAVDIGGGETASTTLDIVLRADIVGGGEEATVVRTTVVDVTVENPAGDADAGGTVEVDTA